MKKNLLLMMLCCPAILAAQNGVTVSNLAVDAGTVTFNVSWNKPMPVMLWSDTVWVFVDYNNNGVMERLPVTGGTASAGTVTKIPSNDKGVWVAGNARTNGSFSAAVKLFTAIKDIGGACVYGSNYPPVGKYTAADKIEFTGTPPYNIVLKNNSGGTENRTENSPYTVPASYTIQSFTDKTGAPGTFTCIPSTAYTLTASAAAYCTGSTVTFALSNTTSGRTYRLYKDGVAVMNALTTTGGAATFTGTFAGAGVYTAQVIAENGNCAAVMTGAHTVSENPVPKITLVNGSGNASQTVNQNTAIAAMTYTASDAATITLRNGSSFPTGVTGAASGNSYTISGTPTAAGTYGYSLTAAVGGCTSTAASGTITVIPVCSGPVFCTSNTWSFGGFTWSDRVVAMPSACSYVSTLSMTLPSSPPPQYIINNDSGVERYYYNWSCALLVCKNGWSIPTSTSIMNIPNNAGQTLLDAWGAGGYIEGDEAKQSSTNGYYWISDQAMGQSYNWILNYSELRVHNTTGAAYTNGLQVRCVKD
jgi:hypothetical protein